MANGNEVAGTNNEAANIDYKTAGIDHKTLQAVKVLKALNAQLPRLPKNPFTESDIVPVEHLEGILPAEDTHPEDLLEEERRIFAAERLDAAHQTTDGVITTSRNLFGLLIRKGGVGINGEENGTQFIMPEGKDDAVQILMSLESEILDKMVFKVPTTKLTTN